MSPEDALGMSQSDFRVLDCGSRNTSRVANADFRHLHSRPSCKRPLVYNRLGLQAPRLVLFTGGRVPKNPPRQLAPHVFLGSCEWWFLESRDLWSHAARKLQRSPKDPDPQKRDRWPLGSLDWCGSCLANCVGLPNPPSPD